MHLRNKVFRNKLSVHSGEILRKAAVINKCITVVQLLPKMFLNPGFFLD